MVVPNREIVDINSFTYNSAMSNSMEPNTISKNVNIDLLRGRSNLSSSNLSIKSLAYSNLSSVLYVDIIEAQNNNSS